MESTFVSRRALGAFLFAAACGDALAQGVPPHKAPVAAPPQPAWPTKPVRLLIGFPPGSVQDLSARAISEALGKALGQPVVVENKSGASGTIAADLVARATDLHTFGVMNNSQLTIAKMLNPAVAYEPSRDLAPIALIGTTPMVLLVNGSAPGKTPQEWLTWLRNLGDKASYGSPGIGTPGHLGMELIKGRTGLTAVHVPFQGNPQIITAMMGGQLQAALLPPGLALQQVRSGKLKAIGVTSDRRTPLAPELPTLREAGVLGADVELWTALAGPASLPQAIRDKLSAAVIDVVKSEATRERLLAVGWQPTPSIAEGLKVRMRTDTKTFGGIILMHNIHAM